jgi:hypothetical protein
MQQSSKATKLLHRNVIRTWPCLTLRDRQYERNPHLLVRYWMDVLYGQYGQYGLSMMTTVVSYVTKPSEPTGARLLSTGAKGGECFVLSEQKEYGVTNVLESEPPSCKTPLYATVSECGSSRCNPDPPPSVSSVCPVSPLLP